MLRKLFLSASICAVLMGISATASAQNDSPYKDTYFTFSQPVALPNLSLPAGRYLFRVVDGSKSIVQVYAGDRSKLLGTVMSVQAARSDLPEKAEVRLIESSAGNPIAVGTWWYPGQRQGWEFVYPRAQASKLAQTSKEPILTTASNVPADKMDSADLVRLSSSGEQPVLGVGEPETSGWNRAGWRHRSGGSECQPRRGSDVGTGASAASGHAGLDAVRAGPGGAIDDAAKGSSGNGQSDAVDCTDRAAFAGGRNRPPPAPQSDALSS